MKRYERLSQEDDYGGVRDDEIKRPKAKGMMQDDNGQNNGLYIESNKKDPLSCLRMDDFEIYLRT